MITVHGTVRAGSATLLVYSGVAARRVTWTLTGPGTLAPLSNMTDRNGLAAARFTPAAGGDVVTIGVSAGA